MAMILQLFNRFEYSPLGENYKDHSFRGSRPRDLNFVVLTTLTPYMVLPLFATRFADYAGGIRVSFI